MIYEFNGSNGFNDLTILFFYSSYTSKCSYNERILLDLDKLYKDINIVKVNVSKFYYMKKDYDILKIPTYVLVKDNKMISKFEGGINLVYLKDWIDEKRG